MGNSPGHQSEGERSQERARDEPKTVADSTDAWEGEEKALAVERTETSDTESSQFDVCWSSSRFPKPPVLGTGENAYGRILYQEDSPNDRSGGEVSFNVILNCTGTESDTRRRVEKTLMVKNMPLRVSDLKSCIEREYNIPSCCQRLVFESVPMSDEDLLKFYHVWDGDTIRVDYPSQGNVAEILSIVDHMTQSYHFIRSIQDDLTNQKVSDDLDTMMHQSVFWEKVNDLPEVYFTPCSSEKAEANRNLFIQCGGLDMLQRLHALLLQQPWSNTPLRMQYLEHSILRTYWNLTAAFTVRLYVLRYPKALGCILRSFLRVELCKNELVKVPKNIYAMRTATGNELNRIACEVVCKAMGALCNLAEIPECRMQIASSQDILKQLVASLVTPSYNSIASLVAMAGMLCLAYSAETHRFLTTPIIIDGVMHACQIKRPDYHTLTEHRRKKKQLLLKYFANVLFAQLITTSPHTMSVDTQTRLLQFMEDFLEVADYKEIRDEEVSNGYKWSTLVPFMKLAYYPYARQRRRKDGKEKDELSADERERLDRCCIKCGIFSLSNVLLCKETREIFMEEGLLDYTLSLPWMLPHDWEERTSALRLVSFLGQNMQLQPPTLINLTKAKLASMHFGLERVLNTDSIHQLLSELYT